MLKIWGRRNSVNVQKVLWCAQELKLQYEHIDAGMEFGLTKESWFLSMNPNGLVPTIKDDEVVLWESNAILKYLAVKYGENKLTGKNLNENANIDMWLDWQLGTVMPGLNPVFLGLVRTPPEKRDNAAIKAGETRLIKAFQSLDQHLSEKNYVTLNKFTVADIAIGCAVNRWYLIDTDHPTLPRLHSWFENLKSRPAFASNVLSVLS